MTWIDGQFPAAVGNHRITSERDEAYNCIAFAAGFEDEWWSYLPGYKWPVERSARIESLIAVFVSLGYEECGAGFERGYDKVALYAKDGDWTHAAWLDVRGMWRSKLGPDEDIEHDTAECLCGDSYGQVHCFMKKRNPHYGPAEEG